MPLSIDIIFNSDSLDSIDYENKDIEIPIQKDGNYTFVVRYEDNDVVETRRIW